MSNDHFEEARLSVPTHINGSEVSVVADDEDDKGRKEVVCKDGKSYHWNPKTGQVYPA